MGLAYVDPEADFSQFNKVMIDPLDVSRVEIVQPNRSAANRRAFELNDADKATLQRHFAEVFAQMPPMMTAALGA